MISNNTFRILALSLPEASELPHFDRCSFRVKKKIFATLQEDKSIACIKFSLADQSVFCAFDKSVIYPVPGKWGLQGWTLIELKKIRKAMLTDALVTAFCGVAPAKFSAVCRERYPPPA